MEAHPEENCGAHALPTVCVAPQSPFGLSLLICKMGLRMFLVEVVRGKVCDSPLKSAKGYSQRAALRPVTGALREHKG